MLPLTKLFLRIADAQGRTVLNSFVLGQFTTLSAGGRRMIRAKSEGSEFEYDVGAADFEDIARAAEDALVIYDQCEAQGDAFPANLRALLATPRVTRTQAIFP